MSRAKRILVLFPSCWDRRHLSGPRFRDRFELVFHDSELWTFPGGLWRILRFDVLAYVNHVCARFASQRFDGVMRRE